MELADSPAISRTHHPHDCTSRSDTDVRWRSVFILRKRLPVPVITHGVRIEMQDEFVFSPLANFNNRPPASNINALMSRG